MPLTGQADYRPTRYENVQKGIGAMMRGPLIQTEARTIKAIRRLIIAVLWLTFHQKDRLAPLLGLPVLHRFLPVLYQQAGVPVLEGTS